MAQTEAENIISGLFVIGIAVVIGAVGILVGLWIDYHWIHWCMSH